MHTLLSHVHFTFDAYYNIVLYVYAHSTSSQSTFLRLRTNEFSPAKSALVNTSIFLVALLLPRQWIYVENSCIQIIWCREMIAHFTRAHLYLFELSNGQNKFQYLKIIRRILRKLDRESMPYRWLTGSR